MLPMLLLLSGCFTSEKPFYEDNQIVQDDRIVGRYDDMVSPTRSTNNLATWFVKRSSSDSAGKYDFLVVDKEVRIELVGTLFRLDKVLFLDLYPVRDWGMRNGSANGPTVSELLHAAMFEPRHLVWRIEPSESGFSFVVPSMKGINAALKEAPELRKKAKPAGESATVLMPENRKEAQAYLQRFATNSAVFDFKVELIRTKKE